MSSFIQFDRGPFCADYSSPERGALTSGPGQTTFVVCPALSSGIMSAVGTKWPSAKTEKSCLLSCRRCAMTDLPRPTDTRSPCRRPAFDLQTTSSTAAAPASRPPSTWAGITRMRSRRVGISTAAKISPLSCSHRCRRERHTARDNESRFKGPSPRSACSDSQVTPPFRQAARKKATLRVT